MLPGCARSPKLNGIDFVLPRLFAGLPVGAARRSCAMGVGGLLKEIDTRPLPREKAPADAARRRRRRAARRRSPRVVLAAGRSRRMAPHNKLLVADRTGQADDRARGGQRAGVQRAAGAGGDRPSGASRSSRRWAAGRCAIVHAADYAEGLSASLKAGIAAVPPECAGGDGLPGRHAAGDRAG